MTRSRKIVMMLIALLGAILLWLYVVTFVTPEYNKSISSVPIKLEGLDVLEERSLIITDQNKTTLSVNMRTSRTNLALLDANSVSLKADVSTIREPGEYTLTCTPVYPNTIRTGDVELTDKNPYTVTITVAEREKKTVRIGTPEWTGAVKEGYLLEAEKAVFEPAEIEIDGPAYDVSRVYRAVVRYDVSEMEGTVVETLPVILLDKDGAEIQFSSEATTVSKSQVTMTLPMYRTKELTLALNITEGGGVTRDNAEIKIEPETIRVKGSAEVIDRLEDEFLLGELELASLPLNRRNELRLALALPDGVTNVSGDAEAIVTVRITGVIEDTLPVSDIRLINQPKGYDCKSSTNTAYVIVRGSREEIREIKADDDNGIYIEVDLTDYTDTGVYTVLGTVINKTHPKISVSETVEIGVVVSVPENEPEEPDGG